MPPQEENDPVLVMLAKIREQLDEVMAVVRANKEDKEQPSDA